MTGERWATWRVAVMLAGALTVSVAPAGAAAGRPSTPAADAHSLLEDEAPAGSALTVTMRRDRFSPDFEVIPVGTTVTWRNEEAGRTRAHDVYAEDGSFGSPQIAPRQDWAFTFTTEGYFQYFCDLHPGMQAALLVVAPDEG